MRQINLTNTQQHYNMCQKKVLIGYTTHQFNKYTAKLQSVAHKSMYLETDQLSCFARHSRKSSSLARAFFCCRTLSVIETCDGNLVSTLLSITAPQTIFLSVMNCLAITWCRSNGFCLREIQVTNNHERRARSTPSLKPVHLPLDWPAT